MLFPQDPGVGTAELAPSGPFVTGQMVTLTVTLIVGREGLKPGARFRVGLPNTGWERAVPPQLRYWDELVYGKERRLAPFHPVNTTAEVKTTSGAVLNLETMERMLLPDEDPAEAYWRWWITALVEEAALAEGDHIRISYGNPQFIGRGARVQTFPESALTISAYVDRGDGQWVRPAGAPMEVDVISGPPARANVVIPSIRTESAVAVRISLTDACHCRPAGTPPGRLLLSDSAGQRLAEIPFASKTSARVQLEAAALLASPVILTDTNKERIWGASNACMRAADDGLRLFWGDLHAQSEYHVMHSQKKNARQADWSKGISCGTPDEVYQYGRDVALLDFVAITDQGANTGVGWEIIQQKAAEYDRPGSFVTFKAYEAGSPAGHRNVYYRDVVPQPPADAARFSYLPEFLYEHYRGRQDVIMIPHHVKTWTDWRYYNPELEPVMEIYSCWGQSEDPSLDRWDKGMTPGAGAWEALRRGYRLGFLASSDNHVGMPGRSYPHDRQAHTPFPGGLAAIWAPELTRESLFDALRQRRCYGTTGARILLRFSVNGQPMGSVVRLSHRAQPRQVQILARGTEPVSLVEVIRNGDVAFCKSWGFAGNDDLCQVAWSDEPPGASDAYYYARVTHADGQMAWSSPVWVESPPAT